MTFLGVQCLVRPWIHVLHQCWFSGSHVFSVWVSLLEYKNWILREIRGAILGSTADTCFSFSAPDCWTIFAVFPVDLDSDPEVFLSVLT